MFRRHLHARQLRLGRSVVPAVAAALLVTLLPAQAFALPPVPPESEPGRETLTLEELTKSTPVSGTVLDTSLESLKKDTPGDLDQAPAGTATPPAAASGSVTFTAAAARSLASASPTALPVGTLPVSLGIAEGQPAPTGTWNLSVDARTDVVAQGVDGAVIEVDPPDTGAVPVSLSLKYGSFKNLYGADWASRLRLVQFPACYLTTPDVEACQAYEELESLNDPATSTVTAIVDPAADDTIGIAETAETTTGATAQSAGSQLLAAGGGDSTVVAAVDSGGGAGGNFKATPLATNGKWSAGSSSGGFAWTYPITLPEAPAGPAPRIDLNYNSQTVDGRTAVSSPQASWIGEGWDYDPGHIERRYRSCQDDRKKLSAGTPNNTAKKDKTSDLCWVSDNAVMSLGGKTTELVRVGNSAVYRPQQDDGSRVELKTGGTNDDNNGEYWLVTTTDGTQYTFGQHTVGGGHGVTNSVSTVPVFGNHPQEPCYNTSFADSRCGAGKQQAWRWGLDQAVDLHGNTMVVNWKQETNYYAPRKKFKSPEQYDRFAYPVSIEYGMRPGALAQPSAIVEFGAEQRCLQSTTVCDPANFAKTGDPAAYRAWWDVPGSLNCKSSSTLCPAFPSFWSQMRLETITTKGARAGQSGLGKVDTYTLHQSFPQDWYDTSPGLWLNSITRTGYGPGDTTGTIQSKEGVSFAPYTVGPSSPLASSRLKDRQLPNLVLSGTNDQRPAFTRPRIGAVATEAGGDIEVEYKGGCTSEPTTDAGKNNGTCFPVRWSPDGEEKTPAKAWFNKYVVDRVIETDKVTDHGRPIVTSYKYTDPAWAKSDDEFQRPSLRTYSEWRGYRQVATTKGSKSTSTTNGDPQSQSYSVTRYFQGTGGALKDTTGTYTLVADDAPQYAGQPAEVISYRDSDKHISKRTLNFPWSKQTATRSREAEDSSAMEPLLAHRAGVRRSDTIQTVGTSWRTLRSETEFDTTYTLPTQVETSIAQPNGTGGETLSEQRCSRTSYVHNTDAWIIGSVKEARTTATPCSGYPTAILATHLISSVRTAYDSLAYGATPVRNLPTSTCSSNAGGTSHAICISVAYDPLGRARKLTKPGEGTTETQYTPADAGGPVTSVKTINAKGHAGITTFDPGRSLPLTVTDANGKVTKSVYDALGRLIEGYGTERSSGTTPDAKLSYKAATATSSGTTPAAVTVRNLKDDGTYAVSTTLYDGLGREAQTQSEAHGAGRIITDTHYNDHGLIDRRTSGYLAKGEPTTAPFRVRSTSLIPSWIKYRYDGMERPVRESTYLGGDFASATNTSYTDTTTLVDPAGSTAPRALVITDAWGRISSVQHYTGSDYNKARETEYTYDHRGYLTSVTDPAGNSWNYTYDARGRVTTKEDPDTGTTQIEYDDADRAVKSVDDLGKTLLTTYDTLGRITAVREGLATNAPVKEYTFDRTGALGLPHESIRHTSGGDYTSRVTGYDSAYRPTSSEVVIPANTTTTGLSGTYGYTYTYTLTGKPESVTLPAKGGLAKEKVVTRYNEDGQPESTSGLAWYTSDVTYSPYGEVLRTVTGAQPYRLWTTNFYDQQSGRLLRTVADRETAAPHTISDSYYSYDESGTITSQARKLSDATTSTWDTQCYTYDVLGQLVNAWTSNIVPDGKGTGCKTSSGSIWGHQADGSFSSGPLADAADSEADTSGSPDASLTSTLAATQPATGTVSTTGATAYRQAFTYDVVGNRATQTDYDAADPAKNSTRTFDYGTAVTDDTGAATTTQPHILASLTSNPAGQGADFTSSTTGNTEIRDLPTTTQQLIWNSENKLETITDDGVKTTYVYDAAGNRLLENSPTGSTLHLGETELTTDSTGKITRASRTYTHPGAPSVTRSTSNGATTGHKQNALITDHLGTANTSIEIGANQPVTRRAFKPYGETRGTKPSTWPNRRSFLGTGIDDTATGLTHIGAREYDQSAGRFLSADPLIDNTDPLQMNGYSYAKNSPISTSDPDGLRPITDCERGCSDGDGHTYRDWLSRNLDGTSSYQYERTSYTYDATWDLVSVMKSGSQRPPEGTKIVYKQYDIKIQTKVIKFLASVALPDPTAWKDCLSGSGVGSCLLAGTDLPFAKALKMIPDKVLKKGADAAGEWLEKTIDRFKAGKHCKCFLAGTDVKMADGGTKNIEDIKVDDEVLATDPETGETGSRKVTRLIVTDSDKHFNKLTINTPDGPEHLTATNEHPFWAPDLGQWVEARNLRPGTKLRTDVGTTVTVTANRSYSAHARTYNLTVDDLHTYYVVAGETPVLVHNSDGIDGPANPAENADPSGLKKMSDSQIKKLVGDVHEFKGDVVGRGAAVSRYDVYVDKGSGYLFLMSKKGGAAIPTYLHKSGSYYMPGC